LLRPIVLYAVPRGRDVSDVYQPGQRRGPETSDGSAAGVQSKMVAAARIEPTRRHDPGVIALEVALLRPGNRRLVPRMALIDRVAERIFRDEHFAAGPVVVVRGTEQDADAEIDVHEVVCDGLSVYDDARRDVHRFAPLIHFFVRVIAHFRVVP